MRSKFYACSGRRGRGSGRRRNRSARVLSRAPDSFAYPLRGRPLRQKKEEEDDDDDKDDEEELEGGGGGCIWRGTGGASRPRTRPLPRAWSGPAAW